MPCYTQQAPTYFQFFPNSSNKENQPRVSFVSNSNTPVYQLDTINVSQVKDTKQAQQSSSADQNVSADMDAAFNFTPQYDFLNYCHVDFAMCQPSAEFDNLYHVKNETPLLLE
jgi:hypothetical protein